MQNSYISSFIIGLISIILLPINTAHAQELNSHPDDRKLDSQIHPALRTSHISHSKAKPSDSPTAATVVDFAGFLRLTNEVAPYRKKRLLSIEDFAAMLKQEGVLLLDSRSKAAFENIHIKGATHLNFSDFTTDKLAKFIPSKNTPILIYCNNNFINGGPFLASKSPALALNIPTFINLYGYGYKNIYELEPTLTLDQIAEHLVLEGTRESLKTIVSPNQTATKSSNINKSE